MDNTASEREVLESETEREGGFRPITGRNVCLLDRRKIKKEVW